MFEGSSINSRVHLCGERCRTALTFLNGAVPEDLPDKCCSSPFLRRAT